MLWKFPPSAFLCFIKSNEFHPKRTRERFPLDYIIDNRLGFFLLIFRLVLFGEKQITLCWVPERDKSSSQNLIVIVLSYFLAVTIMTTRVCACLVVGHFISYFIQREILHLFYRRWLLVKESSGMSEPEKFFSFVLISFSHGHVVLTHKHAHTHSHSLCYMCHAQHGFFSSLCCAFILRQCAREWNYY